MCYDHDECPDDMPCVLGYCGEKQYFEAIGDIQCENDEVCKVSNKHEDIVLKNGNSPGFTVGGTVLL